MNFLRGRGCWVAALFAPPEVVLVCSCMQLRGLYEVLTNTAANLTKFAREAVPKFQVATITGYSLLHMQQASHPRLVALQLSYSARLSGLLAQN